MMNISGGITTDGLMESNRLTQFHMGIKNQLLEESDDGRI